MASKNCFSRLVVGCTAVLVLSACGGGGGDGDGTTEPATITKEATLTLGQEIPAPNVLTPPVPAIGGTMTVTLTTATNALSGTLTLTGDYARVTAAHIHDGDIGPPPGPVVIGLVDGGNGSWSLPATASLTAAQAARFKAGGYYVNAHTAQNAAGEIRGQLLGFADNIQPIFTANCAVSTCHVTPSSSGAPMSLAAGASYGSLVNQTASSGGIRVIPDNSASSVLVTRIGGATLDRMPPSPATLLPANTQNLIKVWIDMGAKNN